MKEIEKKEAKVGYLLEHAGQKRAASCGTSTDTRMTITHGAVWAHTHTHTRTDESVLVLKTPRDSERGLILKCQVWNRIENKVGERRLLVALHVMCTLTHETALCWEYVLHIQATMYI